tara:strand:+ start:147 stop:500 length:354 start_codon:yes stop_codon:yes gene_type:complete
MYKKYEDKLNTILSNAKGERVEKIEFVKISVLEEYEYELQSGIDDLSKFANDATEAIAKGVRELNRLDAVHRIAKKRYAEAEKAAKDLGVKVPQLQRLEKRIKEYEQRRKSLIKVLK